MLIKNEILTEQKDELSEQKEQLELHAEALMYENEALRNRAEALAQSAESLLAEKGGIQNQVRTSLTSTEQRAAALQNKIIQAYPKILFRTFPADTFYILRHIPYISDAKARVLLDMQLERLKIESKREVDMAAEAEAELRRWANPELQYASPLFTLAYI